MSPLVLAVDGTETFGTVDVCEGNFELISSSFAPRLAEIEVLF